MNDSQLLEQHRQGSRDAFTELIRRHIDWVYSVARRRVGDAHLAEDVTQAVFEVLARKTPKLKPGQTLSVWLFGVVNLASKQMLRAESRRRRRETEAAKMRISMEIPETDDWQEIAPCLDDAVQRLGHDDRQAVLLRFYEQKSFSDVGTALGISEEAARKRVSRAVDKLRGRIDPTGQAMSATAIASIILAEVTHPAPAALGQTISALGATSALGKSVIAAMSLAQLKIVTAAAVLALLVSGITTAALMQLAPPTPAAAPTTQIAGNAERARDLLSRYQASIDALNRIYYRFRIETQYEGAWTPGAVPKFKLIDTGEFFRDGRRSSAYLMSEHFDAPGVYKSDFANNPGLFRVINGPDNLQPDDQLSFQSYPKEPQDDWHLSLNRDRSIPSGIFFSIDPMVLWGVVSGTMNTEPLAKLLTNASKLEVRSKTEKIDGHETYVIDARNDHGMHSIWIDPGAGHLARRIEVHKVAGDLESGRPLNRPPPTPRSGSTHIYPLVIAKSWDFVAEIEIGHVDERYVPVGAKITERRGFVDGQMATRHTLSKREEIDFNPDFAGRKAFTIDIPDGTRVIQSDKQGPQDPRFEWRGGKVVQSERLYGRLVGKDGSPIYPFAWQGLLRPEGERRTSASWNPEDIRPDGLFSVSLTSSERVLLMENAGGQIEIRNRAGVIGTINISELRPDPENPPVIRLPRD